MKSASNLVTSLLDPIQVQELPKGCLVGDRFGGRSFNDNIAAALERRSYMGWRDIYDGDEHWTIITVEK